VTSFGCRGVAPFSHSPDRVIGSGWRRECPAEHGGAIVDFKRVKLQIRKRVKLTVRLFAFKGGAAVLGDRIPGSDSHVQCRQHEIRSNGTFVGHESFHRLPLQRPRPHRRTAMNVFLRIRLTITVDKHTHETAFVASAANSITLLGTNRECSGQEQSQENTNLNVLRHMYYNRVALRCCKGACEPWKDVS
jgi:hypothetical protein